MYCYTASEGFNQTLYRYLDLSDKHMRYIKLFLYMFRVGDEDLSAKC